MLSNPNAFKAYLQVPVVSCNNKGNKNAYYVLCNYFSSKLSWRYLRAKTTISSVSSLVAALCKVSTVLPRAILSLGSALYKKEIELLSGYFVDLLTFIKGDTSLWRKKRKCSWTSALVEIKIPRTKFFFVKEWYPPFPAYIDLYYIFTDTGLYVRSAFTI